MTPNSVRLAFILLLLGAFSPAFAQSPQDSGSAADPIVGRWHWFSNELVQILPDGTLTKGGGVLGTWTCCNTAEWPRKYVLDWGHGTYIDTLMLKRDCSFLSGRNQQQVWVHATRSADAESANYDGATAGSDTVGTVATGPGAPWVVGGRNVYRMHLHEERADRTRAFYRATLSEKERLLAHHSAAPGLAAPKAAPHAHGPVHPVKRGKR
jgi:hypothetical protein